MTRSSATAKKPRDAPC